MNEPKQRIDRQLTFEWPKRMERDALIDRIGFRKRPFKKRNGVSPSVLKGVLNRIAKFQVNFEGRTKIGNAVGVTEKQISRAIRVLVSHDLITLDFKKNELARRALNHYQINWNAIRLLVEQQEREMVGPTDGTFSPDHRDIGSPTDGTFSPDHRDIGSPTVGTLGATEREKDLERETTTETEWKPVVVSLEKNRVSQTGKAIAKAKERGDSPDDVLRIIERTVAEHRGKGNLNGIVYNQVCTPTPEPLPTPTTKLKQPKWELIRTKVFRAMQSKGKRPCELDNATIDAKADAIYERELAEFENRQKNPFGTLATEPMR